MNYFNEGNKYYNNKNYRKAIEYYQKSVNEKINEACSLYNIGVCFIKLEDFDTAITVLKKTLSYKLESKYIFNLGYCYVMKKALNTALYHFNLAWSMDPSDTECEKAINLLLSKLN